jgi:hypothetical protein
MRVAGDPATALRKARPTPRRARALLPRRVRSRISVAQLTRADRALDVRARAAGLRVAAHAAAAGDCAGPSTPGATGAKTNLDGVEVTGTGGHWGEGDGPTSGTELTLEASPAPGATKRRSTKECVSWDPCPDAAGLVHGEYHWIFEEVLAVKSATASGEVRVRYEADATLVAHVGDDGRVTTFDVDSTGTVVGRVSGREQGGRPMHVPITTVRTAVHITGADPRAGGKAPQPPTYSAWGVGGSALDGTLKTNIDNMVASALQQGQDLPRFVSKPLLAAERHWYDDAACLDVAFDPQPAEATPNAKIPVNVKVKAKDGAEVAARYEATPVDGAVGPPTGTTPATVTWTAPDRLDRGTFPTFKVVAVSKRGRAVGTHTAGSAAKQHWWTITYSGTGDYHRDEPRSNPYPHLWADHTYTYKMVTQPVRIPYDDAHPEQLFRVGSASVAVTGALTARRVDGGGTSTCAGTPMSDGLVGWADTVAGGDGYDLSVVPFGLLAPAGGSDCSFEDMLHSAPGFEDGIRADLHVSQADLDTKDRIEVHVDNGAHPLTADCRGGAANGDWPCTHSMSWSGTVALERAATPARERP